MFLGDHGWLWYSEEVQSKIAAIRTQADGKGAFSVYGTDWEIQIQKPTDRMWADIEHPDDMLVTWCIGWQYNKKGQRKRAIRQLTGSELRS